MLKVSDMVKNTKRDEFIKNQNDYWTLDEYKPHQQIGTFKKVQYNGDRFIPRRTTSKNIDVNTNFFNTKSTTATTKDVLSWNLPPNYWSLDSMAALLQMAFNIKNKRILQFNEENNIDVDYQKCSFNRKQILGIRRKKDWHCRARKKPFAYYESTHDSVGFSNCFERNMMDWSVNGQVVASFEDNVIIWQDIRGVSLTFLVESASCLAYCPNGKYLAIGCKLAGYSVIELWNISKYSVKVDIVERYFFKTSTIHLQCFEWSKCGKFLVAGTNIGVIYVYSISHLKLVRKSAAHEQPITTIRFSPKMHYLASADISGNIVIHDWFSFSEYLHISMKSRCKILLDWHPWNDVELAVAKCQPASVTILNVPGKEITASYRRKDRFITINSMAFNKITAELLLSISREDLNGLIESKVLVLESLNRVVDVLSIESGARFLMFDPNGTRLITAGSDDSLTVWRFHPDTQSKYNKTSNQMSDNMKKKLFYDYNIGDVFRLCSNIR